MLEPEQEYMLAKRWIEEQDADAAHQMVTSHLRLAAKIAMGYRCLLYTSPSPRDKRQYRMPSSA